MQKRTIHVFGDSHVSVFSGNDSIVNSVWGASQLDILGFNFLTKRLGPHTAYKAIDHKFDPEIIAGEEVMFSFGEIDCRMFLNTKKNIKETVDRYIEYVSMYLDRYEVWILAPPASPLKDFLSIGHPTNGSCKERNEITRNFISHLREKIVDSNINIISIFEDLIDSETMLTKMEYYWDDFHLGQTSIPLFEKEFSKYVGEENGID